MKSSLRLAGSALLAFGAVVLGSASPASAATATSSISVTATVQAYCSVAASPLPFGTYTNTQLDAATTLSVGCTSGTPYTIALDAGTGTGATVASRKMTGSVAGSLLNYSLYRDAARTNVWGTTTGTDTQAGTGSGATQTVNVYGRIATGQLSAPGSYTDTVTVTLTY